MKKSITSLMVSSMLLLGGVAEGFAQGLTVAGDLNGDGVVNVADYVAYAQLANDRDFTRPNRTKLVVNFDNGATVTNEKGSKAREEGLNTGVLENYLLISAAANGTVSTTAPTITVSTETEHIKKGGKGVFNVSYSNNTLANVYSFQFDVVVPGGITIDNIASASGLILTNDILHGSTDANGNTTYRFAYKMTKTGSAKSLNGNLVSFDINVANDFSGSSFPVEIKNSHLALYTQLNEETEDEDENVVFTLGTVSDVVTNNVEDYTVTIAAPLTLTLDEKSTESLAAQVGENADKAIDVINVKRSFVANNWGTIVLPFNVSQAELQAALPGATVCEFVGYGISEERQGSLPISYTFYTKKYTGELQAGKPYFIKVSAAVDYNTGLTFYDKTISANVISNLPRQIVDCTDGSAHSESIIFYGTYFSQDIPGNGLFLAGNKYWFSAVNAPSHSKGYRAWVNNVRVASMSDDPFTITDSSSAAKINMVDDETTGVEAVESTEAKSLSNKVYNVMGQYVGEDTANLPAGVYVKNGKKFTIH